MSLTLKGKNGNIGVFEDHFLNNDNQLEFRNSNLFTNSDVRFVFLADGAKLSVVGLDKEVSILLRDEDANLLKQIETEIKKSLNKLYTDILKGEELLICFPTELDEYPLHITTETILNEGFLSPKYVKALVFALSDGQLAKAGYKVSPNFIDYADIQKRLGDHIMSKNLEYTDYSGAKAIIISLKDALEGV